MVTEFYQVILKSFFAPMVLLGPQSLLKLFYSLLYLKSYPVRQLLVQSQQQKQDNKVLIFFRVNSKEINHVTNMFFSGFFVDFKQVSAGCNISLKRYQKHSTYWPLVLSGFSHYFCNIRFNHRVYLGSLGKGLRQKIETITSKVFLSSND